MKFHSILGFAGVALLVAACSGDDEASSSAQDGEWLNKNCEQTTIGEASLRRLTKAELQNTIEDVFPEIKAWWQTVQLGPDPLSKDGFSNESSMLVMNEQTAKDWLATAEEVADAVTKDDTLAKVLPCASSSADAVCAESFIRSYGRRLFRRALGDEETKQYAALHASVQAKSDFATGIKWVLVSLMQSPHMAYRSEVGVAIGIQRVLKPYEVATALSYTYAGTTPSEALLERAENGGLDTADERIAAARELLDTPRGRKNVQRYADEWLNYSKVSIDSDAARSGNIGPHMVKETEAFLDAVLHENEGGIDDLLTAPYTMLDLSLSRFYGYGEVDNGKFVSVQRPAEWGVGLLAQGSVLAAHSHPDSSSPTLRGQLVYERLLCQTMPAPPADIPPIEPPAPGQTTTRERYEEQHMQSDACKSCHQYTDPTGFTFEHFDAFGRFRADENGLTIDSKGSIPFLDGDREVADQRELATELAASEQVQTCVSALVASYAFGGTHGGVFEGLCAIQGPQQRLIDGEIGLLQYWAELAGTPHFTQRQMTN